MVFVKWRSMGLDRKVVQVGPACRAGHGVIQDTTRGLELQPEPVCPLLDRLTIKARSMPMVWTSLGGRPPVVPGCFNGGC